MVVTGEIYGTSTLFLHFVGRPARLPRQSSTWLAASALSATALSPVSSGSS